MTNKIKAELRAAHLKPSSPVSGTKSQTDDSARAQSRSVSPREQLRVILRGRDSGNFEEFKSPATLRKVGVADNPEEESPMERNENNNQSEVQCDKG